MPHPRPVRGRGGTLGRVTAPFQDLCIPLTGPGTKAAPARHAPAPFRQGLYSSVGPPFSFQAFMPPTRFQTFS